MLRGVSATLRAINFPRRPLSCGRRAGRNRRVVGVEPLESRRLLAVSATLASGKLTISYGAGLIETAQISSDATNYVVSGTGLAAKSFAKSAVTSINVVDKGKFTQSLKLTGAAAITSPITVGGIETTELATDISLRGAAGDVVLGGVVTLSAGPSRAISNPGGKVTFGGRLEGAVRLSIDAPGQLIEFLGTVGKQTPLAGIEIPRAGAVVGRQSITLKGPPPSKGVGLSFGVDVAGVLLDGAGSSVTGFDKGIVVAGSPSGDAWTRTISNFKIFQNYVGIEFSGNGPAASVKAGTYQWNLTNNTFFNNLHYGIRFTTATASTTSRNPTVRIAANTVDSNNLGGIRIDGTPDGLLLSENVFLGNGFQNVNGGSAIDVTDGRGVARKSVLISNNWIKAAANSSGSVRSYGIAVNDTPGLRIVGNVIDGQDYGIVLRGRLKGGDAKAAVVSGNVINSPGWQGISLAARDVTIDASNVVNGDAVEKPIVLSGLWATGDCAGSVVQGMTVKGVQGEGITLLNVTGLTLAGVQVTGNQRGLGARGVCTGTIVDGGLFKANLAGKFPNLQYGASVGAKGLLIKGATFQGNSYGIVGSGGCEGSVISGCSVVGNKEAGIRFVGPSVTGLTVAGCVVSGSSTGLYADGVDCSKTTVSGSAFSGCTQGATLQAVAGLTITDASSFNGNQEVGVRFGGVCTGTKLVGAKLVNNTTRGIALNSASGVTIDGANITGGGAGLTATGACTGSTVAASTFTDCTSQGLSLNDVQGLAVSGSMVKAKTGAGLRATGALGGTAVSGSTFSGGTFGISLENGKQLALTGNMMTSNGAGLDVKGDCAGTVISACTATGNIGDGVGLYAAKAVTFNGANKFDGNGGNGLSAEGNCSGTTITGGTYSSNQVSGFRITAAEGLKLSGVAAVGNGWHGLSAVGVCTGTTVTGSSFTGGKKSGVSLSGAKNLAIGSTTASGNAGQGFRAELDCTGSTITAATATGNGGNGLAIFDAAGLAVKGGGKFDGNGVNGLFAGGICTGTTVSGSSFSTNGGAGVVLSDARGVSLSGNSIASNTGDGIRVDGASTGTSISGNTVSDNKLNGLVFSATSGLTVNGANKFTSNGGNGVYGTGLCTGTVVNGGNTISANAYSGIQLVDAKAVSATKNSISGNKYFGLYAKGMCAGTNAMDNTLTGNTPGNVYVNTTGGDFPKP